MKSLDRKDTPEVSGGVESPEVIPVDSHLPIHPYAPYPRNPITPVTDDPYVVPLEP